MGVHRTPVKHIRKIIFTFFPTSAPRRPRLRPAKASASVADRRHIFVRLRLQRRSASALKTKDRHHTASFAQCQAGRRKISANFVPGGFGELGWRWFAAGSAAFPVGNRGLQRASRAAPSWFPAPRADAASAHLSQLHHRIRSAAFDDFTGGHDTVSSHPSARGTSLPASAFSVMAILVVATAHAAAPEDAYSACRGPAGDGPTARPCLRAPPRSAKGILDAGQVSVVEADA